MQSNVVSTPKVVVQLLSLEYPDMSHYISDVPQQDSHLEYALVVGLSNTEVH